MPNRKLAIALCRVSSIEQLENNSLNRQRAAVLKGAAELGVTIPDDAWWSGYVSSKKGTNVDRKDLNEMVSYCKKNKNIKYVIVDIPDRFMRSVKESNYFEVIFESLGVKVWYASDPELNKDDLGATVLKFARFLAAEGSNDDRIAQSIGGATAALKEGRYPFAPKPGYMRGTQRGIPSIHPERGPALQKVLRRLAAGLVTPTHALIELNNSDFTKDHSPYKMDKFSLIAIDAFYAGVIEINKQVKVRNENGLHEPLISLAEHEKLLKIMAAKPKYQKGPNKKGNPKYPLNNIVIDDLCIDCKSDGKLVGFDHTNGKNTDVIYEKYRCRSCGRYWHRSEMHQKVTDLFDRYELSQEARSETIDALGVVWEQNQAQTLQETKRLQHEIKSLQATIAEKVDAATDPSNAFIKQDLMASIQGKKKDLAKLEDKLDKLAVSQEDDKQEFMEFALGFIEDTGKHFLQEYVSKENRLRCKLLIFPGGIFVDQKNKVYTREVSPIYRLAAKKKDAEASYNSQMVRVKGL